MIYDEDSFTSGDYEIDIMQLWDNLPDHYKTAGLLNKIKRFASDDCLQTFIAEHLKPV
jgi:hypothetical protein